MTQGVRGILINLPVMALRPHAHSHRDYPKSEEIGRFIK